jgi:hypothetical protein
MDGSDDKPQAASKPAARPAKADRESRLAAALRANLRRRKAPRRAEPSDPAVDGKA